MGKQQRYEVVKRIGIGYIVIAIFLSIFIFLTGRFVVHQHLNQPQWASAVALILVLPIILIPVSKYLWPRLTGIKISNIFELSSTAAPTDALAKRFNEIGMPDRTSMVDYSVSMGDGSKEIMDTVNGLERSRQTRGTSEN